MTVDELGRLRWTPTVENVGTHAITIEVIDELGTTATQTRNLEVSSDTISPVVKVLPSGVFIVEGNFEVPLGNKITFFTNATDNIGVQGVQLFLDEVPVTLTANGVATYTPSKLGILTAKAVALDAAGNLGESSIEIRVYDPNDLNPPIVELSPALGEEPLTDFTDIIGTVTDDNLTNYVLSIAPASGGEFVEIASGNSQITNGKLGEFDPTLLQNDTYILRLTATDESGNSASTEQMVDVAGELKLGNFRLSFTDLEIPVAGIPINLTRTYDTLTTNQSDDFGYGWRLEFRDTDLRTSVGRDKLYEQTGIPSVGFEEGTRVYVTLPGGKRTGFTFKPVMDPEIIKALRMGAPLPQSMIFYNPAFETDDGEQVTLSAPKTQLLYNQNTGQYYHPSGTPYNPANSLFGGIYALTTKEGIEYKIDGTTGDLLTVKDTNGNVLTYSDSGITSDSGVSVTFQRDAAGRIVSVTDPEGNQINYEYDEAGDLVSVTDVEEYVTKFVYDVPNRTHYLNEIIDPLNRPAVRSEYQEDGRLKKIIDVDGDPVEFVYNPENSTQTVKDALGNPTLYEYDARGNVIQQVNALGHSTRLEYDDNNNVTQATDANGNVANYTYDNQGNLLSRTEFHHPDETNPEITRYTYNQFGQTTKVILPTGAVFSMEYDESGNLLAMLDSEGNAIQSYVYDQYGRVVEESDSTVTNYYGNFDAFGNPRWTKDAFGEETTMTYDTLGQLVSMTSNDETYTFEYDGRGRQTRADYGDGIWVEYGYGAEQDWTSLNAPTIGYIERRFTDDGKLGGWLTPGGGEIVFNYDEAGRLSSEIDPSGQVTRYVYDKIGRVERIIDSSTGLETINHYDSLVGIDPDPEVGDNLIGKLSGRTVMLDADTSYTTSSTYYPSGNVKTSTDPRNNTWYYGYTSTTSTVTDPLGRQTTTVRSPEYLPIETVYADGTRETIEYLYNNNLQEAKDYPTVITDRGGNDRHFTYDELGRLQAATDLGDTLYNFSYEGNDYTVQSPTGETLLRYDYNDDGNLSIVTYLDGSTRELTYSETDNRIKTEKLPSGVTVNYEYDSAGLEARRVSSLDGEVITNWDSATGNMLSVTDSTGTTTYNYDLNTQSFSGLDYPNGGSIEYERDILGRVEKVIVKASSDRENYTTEYKYDPAGNLARIIDPNLGETAMVYDAVNRLVERTLPNGVKTTYIYKENTDYLEKITHLAADGTVISSMEYDRNPSGEPTKIVREDGSYTEIAYDASLRVVKESHYDSAGNLVDEIAYSYNAQGDRQAVSSGAAEGNYTYENLHQLTQIETASGTENYSYDAGGRVETVTRDGETLRLEYNTDDQLVRVTNGDGNLVVEYEYDSEGRRVEVTDSTGERDYIVAPTMGDGLSSPHLVVDENSEVISGYVYAGDKPLMRLDENGNPIYYLTDAMGSVTGLVDENGQEVGSFLYDSFGNLRESEGSLIVVPEAGGDFRFQGQWLESNTDFYHFRARYYDPETGRFISRDPVEIIETEPESGNPYQFVYNNPLIYSDPTGLFTMVELQSRFVTEQALNSVQLHLSNYARQYLIDKAKGVATDIFTGVAERIISNLAQLNPLLHTAINDVLSNKQINKVGGAWENLLKGEFTKFIGEFFPEYLNAVWFEAEVSKNGAPQSDGINLSEVSVDLKSNNGQNNPNPDFIIKTDGGPESTDFAQGKGKKSYLVGDFKFSWQRVESDRKKPQFEAMMNYARFINRHQVVPIALYITMIGGKGTLGLHRVTKEAIQNHAVYPQFLTLFPGIQGLKQK